MKARRLAAELGKQRNIFNLVGKLKENVGKGLLPNVPLIIYFKNDLMTKRRHTYHQFP
jgi:hypothetical protein